jgi:hypothetical protein
LTFFRDASKNLIVFTRRRKNEIDQMVPGLRFCAVCAAGFGFSELMPTLIDSGFLTHRGRVCEGDGGRGAS